MPLRRLRASIALAAGAALIATGLPAQPAEAQWWKRSTEAEKVNYGIRFLDGQTFEPVTAPFSQARAGERQLVRIALYELRDGDLDPAKPLPRGPSGPVSIKCTTSNAEVARFEPERSLIVRSGGDAFAEFWFVASQPGSVRIDAVADLGDEHMASTWFGPVRIAPAVVPQPRRLKPKPDTPDTSSEPAQPADTEESRAAPATEPKPPAATTNPMALGIPLPRPEPDAAKPSTLPELPPQESPTAAEPRAQLDSPPIPVEPEPAPVEPEAPLASEKESSPPLPTPDPADLPEPASAPPVLPTPQAPTVAEPEPDPAPEISRDIQKAGFYDTSTGRVAVPTPPSPNEQEAIAAIGTPTVAAEELDIAGDAQETPATEQPEPTQPPAPTQDEEAETDPPPAPTEWPDELTLPCPRFERLTLENVSDAHLRVQIRVAGSPTPLAATMKPGETRRLKPGSSNVVWIEAQRPTGEQRGVRLVAANMRSGDTSQVPPFATPWLKIGSTLADCAGD